MTDWENNYTSITNYGEIDARGMLHVDEFAITGKFNLLMLDFTARASGKGYVVNHTIDPAQNFELRIWLTKAHD